MIKERVKLSKKAEVLYRKLFKSKFFEIGIENEEQFDIVQDEIQKHEWHVAPQSIVFSKKDLVITGLIDDNDEDKSFVKYLIRTYAKIYNY